MRFPAVLSRLLAFAIFLHFVSAAVVAPLLKHQIEELARNEDDAEQLLNRRQSSANSSGYTVVTGIQGTGTQPRLEIRQLEKNADQWNIYLLGMNRFMRSNQSEKLSYYQVAGKSRYPKSSRVHSLTFGRNSWQTVCPMGRRRSGTWC